MNIYLLNPVKDWEPWYDKIFGFVVVAENEKNARKLASMQCGDEGPGVWLRSEYTSCKIVPTDKEEVILRDLASA